MFRVSLKNGNTFFTEDYERDAGMIYFSLCSETISHWEKDADGQMVKKVNRREIGDIAFASGEVREIKHFKNHFIPMLSFKGLAEAINKEDEAHTGVAV